MLIFWQIQALLPQEHFLGMALPTNPRHYLLSALIDQPKSINFYHQATFKTE